MVNKNTKDLELEQIALRISVLRLKNDVSARRMSRELSFSAGYMSKIESQKFMPSMDSLVRIIDYLGVTPQEFFNFNVEEPGLICEINNMLRTLDRESLLLIYQFASKITGANRANESQT